MTAGATGVGPPPHPPGAPGAELSSEQILDYLSAMLSWRAAYRAAIDATDARARAIDPDGTAVVADVTLAYTLWQSISTRLDEIAAVWDSGRVGEVERLRVSRLISGRLDVTPGGLPVSISEACVLADALLGRLTARVEDGRIGGSALAQADAIRASITRSVVLATDLGVSSGVEGMVEQLDRALATATAPSAARAAITRIDAAASTAERDLILTAAARNAIERRHAAIVSRLADAVAEGARVRRLAQVCRELVAPAPVLAVPDPGHLGPVPQLSGSWSVDQAALDTFSVQLGRVEKALRIAAERYAAPLAEHEELTGLLAAYHAKAGRAAAPAPLREQYDQIRSLLDERPCGLAVVRALLDAYRRDVDSRKDAPGSDPTRTESPKGGPR